MLLITLQGARQELKPVSDKEPSTVTQRLSNLIGEAIVWVVDVKKRLRTLQRMERRHASYAENLGPGMNELRGIILETAAMLDQISGALLKLSRRRR